MKYVGLTDDPVRRRQDHGNPKRWREIRFSVEKRAREWVKATAAKRGYTGGGTAGWKYGYIYRITRRTRP